MNAPSRVSTRLFNLMVDEWLKEHSHITGKMVRHSGRCLDLQKALGESWKEDVCKCNDITEFRACNVCGDPILYKRALMSVHDSSWDNCAGYGQVLNPTIPYCATCEPNPLIFGCVHEPEVSAPTERKSCWRQFLEYWGLGRFFR